MDFGIFTDFPVREGMVVTEAFDEAFSQVELADRIAPAWIRCGWLNTTSARTAPSHPPPW